MNTNRLKEKLRTRLLDKSAYGTGKLTLTAVTSKALQIALQVIDEVAEQSNVPRSAREPSPRKVTANEKRQRLLKVMQVAGKPLHVSEIQKKAYLTTGEAAWLVRSTPGVVQVDRGIFELRVTS